MANYVELIENIKEKILSRPELSNQNARNNYLTHNGKIYEDLSNHKELREFVLKEVIDPIIRELGFNVEKNKVFDCYSIIKNKAFAIVYTPLEGVRSNRQFLESGLLTLENPQANYVSGSSLGISLSNLVNNMNFRDKEIIITVLNMVAQNRKFSVHFLMITDGLTGYLIDLELSHAWVIDFGVEKSFDCAKKILSLFMTVLESRILNEYGIFVQFDGHPEGFIQSIYQQPNEIQPDDAVTLYNWGSALWILGLPKEAIQKYQQVNEIRPEHASTLYNWGVTLMNFSRSEEAIQKFQQANEIRPDDADTLFGWGLALDNLGRYGEAIQKYQQANEIRPNHVKTLVNWGLDLTELRRYEEAIQKYQQANEIRPDHANTLVNWGITLDKLGCPEEAIQKYQQANEIKPEFPNTLYNWGLALEKLGCSEEAIQKYQQAIVAARATGDKFRAERYERWLKNFQSRQRFSFKI